MNNGKSRSKAASKGAAGRQQQQGSAQAKAARAVFDSIRRIVRVLRLSARHTEKTFGLSAAQLFVLHKLAEADAALTPSELAEKALTDQSSVSVVVQRLVDRGYVQRERSTEDARSFNLSLTEAGSKVVRKSPDTTQDRLLDALMQMPVAHTKQLAELLEELVGHTGIAGEQATMLMEDEPRG